MLEFPKSNCLYHPSETITNFCRTCLLPLCPSCVCSHIDFHVKSGDHPKFDNIQDTFSNTHRAMGDLADQLLQDRRRMAALQSSYERMTNRVSDTIFQLKLKVRELIESRFQDLEKEILTDMSRQSQATGLYSKPKLEYLEKKIADGTKELTTMLEDMQGERSLPTMILFHGEKKQSLEKLVAQLDREVELNYDFDPKLTLNNDAFDLLKRGVSQVLDVKLNLPVPEASRRVSTQPSLTPREVQRETVVFERSPLAPIVNNKRLTPQTIYFTTKENPLKQLPSRFRSPSQNVHYSPAMRPSSLMHRQPSFVITAQPRTNQEYMASTQFSGISPSPMGSTLVEMTSTGGASTVRDNSNSKRGKKSGITLQQNTDRRPSKFSQKTPE